MIAIINSVYKPNTRGGAEVVVENITHGLKKRGEDFFVVSVGRENKLEEVDDVKVYRIKPFNIFNFLDIDKKPVWLRFPWHILDMFSDVQAWRIYKVLKKEKPNVVYTHNLKGLGYYIPWLLKVLKVKHIHTVHDMQLIHPSGLLQGKKNSMGGKLYSFVCRKLFNSPDVVIFPSEYIKNIYTDLKFFKKSKIEVLGNPIEVESLKVKKFKVESRQKTNILFLGQVEEYKGILDLIGVVKNIKTDLTLHVVGDGSALKKAKKMAGGDERIKFYGQMSQEELKEKIWPHIDLLVNPSRVPESFGMVVIEAFSYGIPALVSNIGALPDIVSDNKTGWLFESGNRDELQKKLEYLLKNMCGYGSIGMICQQEAKKYDIEAYLNKMLIFGNINEN